MFCVSCEVGIASFTRNMVLRGTEIDSLRINGEIGILKGTEKIVRLQIGINALLGPSSAERGTGLENDKRILWVGSLVLFRGS